MADYCVYRKNGYCERPGLGGGRCLCPLCKIGMEATYNMYPQVIKEDVQGTTLHINIPQGMEVDLEHSNISSGILFLRKKLKEKCADLF